MQQQIYFVVEQIKNILLDTNRNREGEENMTITTIFFITVLLNS